MQPTDMAALFVLALTWMPDLATSSELHKSRIPGRREIVFKVEKQVVWLSPLLHTAARLWARHMFFVVTLVCVLVPIKGPREDSFVAFHQ